MSTYDVPGAKAENRDELSMGCWAEHGDGSLIFVNANEGGDVVYSVFDLSGPEPVEYRDAMAEVGFKEEFTWDGDKDDKWLWHDKTAFPWERVMENFQPGQRFASAGGILSAAQRVAEKFKLRAEKLKKQKPQKYKDVKKLAKKLNKKIAELGA